MGGGLLAAGCGMLAGEGLGFRGWEFVVLVELVVFWVMVDGVCLEVIKSCAQNEPRNDAQIRDFNPIYL